MEGPLLGVSGIRLDPGNLEGTLAAIQLLDDDQARADALRAFLEQCELLEQQGQRRQQELESEGQRLEAEKRQLEKDGRDNEAKYAAYNRGLDDVDAFVNGSRAREVKQPLLPRQPQQQQGGVCCCCCLS